MVPWLDADRIWFPSTATALPEPNGLLAVGGDLSVPRLVAAYQRGIFPWFNAGEPILWWSPAPRTVLEPTRLRIPRSLAKVVRHRTYRVTFDRAFPDVIRLCAAPHPRRPATWITPQMQSAYIALHRAGFAHSAECWIDGELAGGLYGVALGRMFYGESMFALQPDASKIAFVHLVRWLAQQGYALIDCQMQTEHLARFGAAPIPRAEFERALQAAGVHAAEPVIWHYDVMQEGAQRESA
ncbi:leucyl/phenylalanyl-tRNA--protein transferase [Chitinibacteraceae bacterium HSL-7]